MNAPVKEQQIPITNLDAERAKMHQKLGKNTAAAGHPGETRPPHEEDPLTGTLKEFGPYVISGLKEVVSGKDSDSRDRFGRSADVASILDAKEDKKEAA